MEYTVKRGDTLWGIAQKYLGSGARWRELGYTGDPRHLPVNYTLRFNADNGALNGTSNGASSQSIREESSVSPASDYLSSVEKTIDKLLPTVPDPIKPFSFDEELAKRAVTAEVSPYYDEMMNDYLSDVNKRKQRATEDSQAELGLLSSKKEMTDADIQRDYEYALEKARNGYAGRNMYFSGKRGVTEERIGTEKDVMNQKNQLLYDYDTGNIRKTTDRTLSDLETAAQRRQRDIGREKEYQIERGVLNRRNEQMEEYTKGAIPTYYGDSGFGYR